MPYKNPEDKKRNDAERHQRRKGNPEVKALAAARQRKYLQTEKGREKRAKRAKTPETKAKYRARHQLWYAVKMGRVEKMPCRICGSADSQGHHDDYNKPLEADWLCQVCHMAEKHSK